MTGVRLRATSLAAVAAILLPALPAHAGVIDIAWSGNGEFQHSLTLAPGKSAELCGKLPAGLKVRWDFEASAPLDFNVHYHAGKDVVFASKLAAVASAKDTLATKIDQDYCWMWSNKSAGPATILVKLQR